MSNARFDAGVTDLLTTQSGIVGRHQLRALGVPEHTIQRWLRGRHLVTVMAGVYVAHTGHLSGRQRAWAGVLHAWPAALSGETAVQVGLRREPTGMIELAIDRDRHVATPPGYRITRRAHLQDHANWNLSPPRLRIEQAVLDVAARHGDSYAAIETLAAVCREGATTPDRLLAALDTRQRLPHRAFLGDVLYDVRDGATSVLERGYLALERAHGLPRATRQRREELARTVAIRDAEYEAYGLVVELDGQAFHGGAQHQQDPARDMLVALEGRTTVRIGWRQVVEDGCTTAAQVARLLTSRGWRGTPRPCSPSCLLARAA